MDTYLAHNIVFAIYDHIKQKQNLNQYFYDQLDLILNLSPPSSVSCHAINTHIGGFKHL